MKTISFASIKGGVGKSSMTIQIANCLAASSRRVLVIDMDLNNSVSSYYLTDETKNQLSSHNIANALDRPDNKLSDYALPTARENLSIIPSSLYLIDRRGMTERRLAQLIPSVECMYDFVLIDTQPTYDNIVLNAYNASDFIITPVNLSLFDFNTAEFLRDKIRLETDKIKNWFLVINGYNCNYEKSKAGSQAEYINLFKSEFENMLPSKCYLPWTSAMRNSIDRNMKLSYKRQKNCLCNEKLYNAITEMVDMLLEENESISKVEAF